MRLKLLSLLLVCLLAATPSLIAGSDKLHGMFEEDGDDFSQFDDIEQIKKRELLEFKAERDSELQAFRDERDRDFAEFLKAKWEAFNELEGLVKDPKPKPRVIPKAKKSPLDKVDPKGGVIIPPAPPVKKPKPVPEKKTAPLPKVTPVPAPDKKPGTVPEKTAPTPPAPKPVPPTPEPAPPPAGIRADVSFYGSLITIFYDPGVVSAFNGKMSNRGISNYWISMSKTDHEGLIHQLRELKNRLALNDWGYYQLVLRLSESIHKDSNSRCLFSWFTMIKSGYRVKLGYNGSRMFLFAPSEKTIYQTPYLSIDGRKFYNLTHFQDPQKIKRIYTYKNDYPDSDHLLVLDLQSSPKIGEKKQARQLRFRYEGRTYHVTVKTSGDAVRFFNRYPQTEWPVYIGAPTSLGTERSLLQGFSKIIKGKSETEAVNMLLRFVQTAFKYQTDQEQFGREKYMFAEETLFSNYSDCEDRSFLFIYLVRRLIGLEAVALHYPGHMAAAILFSEFVSGDSVTVDGRRFVVCDPTYINANIGNAMPQFKKVKPKVVRHES